MTPAAAPFFDGRVRGPDGRPVAVERAFESHIAHVFVDDRRAYKVRKPVSLGFLDYASRAQRRRATDAELAIGRRVAPHVYRGCWSLTPDGALRPDAGQSGEPVLVMTRLDDALRADRVLADRAVPPARLDAALGDCVRFHEAAPVDRRPDGWGAPPATWRAFAVNFDELPSDAPDLPLDPAGLRRLRDAGRARFEALEPVLRERIADGRIREGHGDLRLEHVYLTRPWSVIDPLEFSRSLRFCDTAAEIAFFAMELDAIGRPDAAQHALAEYARSSHDHTLATVAPFFLAYRALVRAKVGWFRAAQLVAEPRDAELAQARRLAELALAYLDA